VLGASPDDSQGASAASTRRAARILTGCPEPTGLLISQRPQRIFPFLPADAGHPAKIRSPESFRGYTSLRIGALTDPFGARQSGVRSRLNKLVKTCRRLPSAYCAAMPGRFSAGSADRRSCLSLSVRAAIQGSHHLSVQTSFGFPQEPVKHRKIIKYIGRRACYPVCEARG